MFDMELEECGTRCQMDPNQQEREYRQKAIWRQCLHLFGNGQRNTIDQRDTSQILLSYS